MNRIPKPMYFFQRWKSATTDSKRQYYADRLKSLVGINVTKGDEVIHADDTTAMVGINICNIASHVKTVTWRS